MGSAAKRRVRPTSIVLGRRSRVSKSTCKILVSLSWNPVQKQPLDTQIAFHNIPVQTRQLQRLLKRYTKGGGQYLCAFIKKTISTKNLQEQTIYGDTNVYRPLFGFFDYIVYTDKAHIDPTSQA